MPNVRFNHMELTFPRGGLSGSVRADIDRFYGGVLGWRNYPYEVFDQPAYILQPDPRQFILLTEVDEPISAPSFDHLGLLVDDHTIVDDLLEKCHIFEKENPGLELRLFDDLITEDPHCVCHAFYVKYVLPIWFDVQSLEFAEAA